MFFLHHSSSRPRVVLHRTLWSTFPPHYILYIRYRYCKTDMMNPDAAPVLASERFLQIARTEGIHQLSMQDFTLESWIADGGENALSAVTTCVFTFPRMFLSWNYQIISLYFNSFCRLWLRVQVQKHPHRRTSRHEVFRLCRCQWYP